VAQVVESRIDGIVPGDFVFCTNGWAEYGLMGEGVARPSYMIPRKLDPAQGRISHAVGVLGMLGLTAYAGLVLQCEPKPGDTAVVSAASGGVGQIAGQIARLKGCRVVGIGQLLRGETRAGTRRGLEVADLMAAGALLDDRLVLKILNDRLAGAPDSARSGWLLDGFPRTQEQVEASLSAPECP
jgi:hypothetical protein